MTYKVKAAFLSALVAVLAVIYILILVFDRDYRRSDVFAWLDPNFIVMADRIEITGDEGKITLNRRNNIWVFEAGNMELPVRQSRVEDLFTLLSARAAYPLRATSREAMESLFLTEETAYRITVRGGAGLPLLDLLVGAGDVLGREVFLRMAGQNQIHSGEGDFIFFANMRPTGWYDLGLFQPFSIDMVQQADVVLPHGEAFILRRGGSGWVIPGESAAIETQRVDAWLRSLSEAQAEDLVFDAPEIFPARISLRFGDGSTLVLEAGVSESESWRARVSGSLIVYSLSDWVFNRIFREKEHFLRN